MKSLSFGLEDKRIPSTQYFPLFHSPLLSKMFQVYKWEKAVEVKPKQSLYNNMTFEFQVNQPELQVKTVVPKRNVRNPPQRMNLSYILN